MKKLSSILVIAILALSLCIPAIAADTATSNVYADAYLYLSFDDTLDNAGSSDHAVAAVGTLSYVEGKNGKAVNTSMGANYLTVDGLGQAFGTESFTVTTWIKANAYVTSSGVGDCMLFGNTDWGTSGTVAGWGMIAYSANDDGTGKGLTLHSVFGDGTGDPTVDDSFWNNKLRQDYNSGYKLEAAWTHISLVVDATAKTFTLYVNGEQYGTPYCYGDATNGVQNGYASLYSDDLFCIGCDANGGYNTQDAIKFNVDFDDFAVFQSALTADQVAAVYAYAPAEEDTGSSEDTGDNTGSPDTFDALVVTAVVSIVSFAGVAITRKRK